VRVNKKYRLLWLYFLVIPALLLLTTVLTSNYVKSKPICPTCTYRMYEKGWQYYNKWIDERCNDRALRDTQERYGYTSYDLVYEWICEREKAINAVKERINK